MGARTPKRCSVEAGEPALEQEVRHGKPARWRLLAVSTVATLCFLLIGVVFWQEDVRYSLPTPRPHDWPEVPIGTTLSVASWFRDAGAFDARVPLFSSLARTRARFDDPDTGPLLLHFFNPECSCSRFNLEHLRTLRQRYAGRVRFLAVVQATGTGDAAWDSLQVRVQGLELGMPFVFDREGAMARQAGIYATPQAVLLDDVGRIVYRGNYNRARYCTDRRTEFVRIAIDSLLASRSPGVTETRAYGCALPSITLRASGGGPPVRAAP